MENALPRFSSRVESYIKYRPGYPQALIDLLRKECHLTTNALIADIGSGTGKLTGLFLNNGYRVWGIEPDPDMRAAAQWLLRGYPRFTSIAATAEATSLANHSIDVVTAGQAFHWFDHEQARREFFRILVPKGWAVLVCNIQRTTGTAFLAALEQFWQTYLSREGLHAEATGQDLSTLLQQTKPIYRWRLHPEQAEQDLMSPLFRPGAYRVKTFENHQVDGTITIEQETCVYYGQLSNT